ncbi:MAG: isoprenylcysteine carboxylmethyltransferase family protein [Candidatus Heimdallarchaeota archaeon]|nr:MAG: isoprenylcysteine carboxylmethyltransferase family protein [Candidatus Heimdallarchaeota archaeon]
MNRKQIVLLKLMGLPILFIFMNIIFLLFEQEVFTTSETLLPILLIFTFIGIDIVIRPISEKKDEYNRLVISISFLALPIMLFLPYIEGQILIQNQFFMKVIGLTSLIGNVILVVGGAILVLSRIQTGEYGGPKIVIEDKHRLITTGLYRYIRHPMYSGFLLLFFGYSFSFGSIIITVLILIIFFVIFKSRMDLEEKLLLSSFGEEYQSYIERTNRLIPFLY